jgi:hypothetical protein
MATPIEALKRVIVVTPPSAATKVLGTAFIGDVAPPGPTNNGTINTAGAPNSITAPASEVASNKSQGDRYA